MQEGEGSREEIGTGRRTDGVAAWWGELERQAKKMVDERPLTSRS